jgi:hypothetical protein
MNIHFLRRKFSYLYYIYLVLTQKYADKKLIGAKKSFGNENPDKTFFVIRLNNPNLGLFAIHNCVLGYLRISDINGYIPVVDLKNYKNGYLENEEIGLINAWEYYFEQTSNFSLDEVYRSKNVIFSSGISPREASPPIMHNLLKFQRKSHYYLNLAKKHLKIKNNIQQIIDRECHKLINGKKIIGVVSRGSDMLNLKGHAIQLDVETLIVKTKQKLMDWNCDYVFLATEEERIVEIFRKHFDMRLIINESFRVKNFDKYIPLVYISSHRENDKYHKGLEYLTTVVILSRCNCLIGSLIGSTVGALGMNQGKYENTCIYDLGVYK